MALVDLLGLVDLNIAEQISTHQYISIILPKIVPSVFKKKKKEKTKKERYFGLISQLYFNAKFRVN